MSSARSLTRLCAPLLALASMVTGAALAWHHPLWPGIALLALTLWCALLVWRPGIWLCVVPACVPWLNFSPWTGWLIFDELDLLLLGTLAAGYGQGVWAGRTRTGFPLSREWRVWTVLLGGSAAWGLFRGFSDAGGFSFDWYCGYTGALNSLRIFKSLGFALLCWPLLLQELKRAPAQAGQRLAVGMLAGLVVAVLAVVWERAAFPGWLNFSSNYRTAGLFWEMHVGGAAMDGYLALSSPFVVWALLNARRPACWMGAAVLTWLTAYAVLTTFSRGVYFASAASLALLVLLLHRRSSRTRRTPLEWWHAPARLALLLALSAEVLAVLSVDSFMTERLASTHHDFNRRLAHWRSSLSLLHDPGDWLLGRGLGRFPGDYAMQSPVTEFSGALDYGHEQIPGQALNGFATLQGPPTLKSLGGQFSMTQQLGHASRGPHQVGLDVRVKHAVDLQLEVCERHLLYDASCQTGFLHVQPRTAAWQSFVVPLEGGAMSGGPWYAPRLTLFALSIVNIGAMADIDNLHLKGQASDAPQLIANGDFSHQLAHWFPVAQSYFLPWHVDNLFLEWLVERGWMGLLLLCTLVGAALWRLANGRARASPLSPYLFAAIGSAMCVGTTSSLMDVPRVAFLLFFLVLYAMSSDALTSAAQGTFGIWHRSSFDPCGDQAFHAKNQSPESPSAQTPFPPEPWSLDVTKLFNYYFHKRSFSQIFLDLGLVLIAVVTSFLSQAPDTTSDSIVVAKVALLLGIGILAINAGLGFYQRNRTFTPRQVRLRALLSLAFTLPLAYTIFRMLPLRPQDEKAFLLALVLAMVLMLIHRIYVTQSTPKELSRPRILVYGCGPRAKLVGSMLHAVDPHTDLVGYYVGPNEQRPDTFDQRLLPPAASLTDLVLGERIDEIIVALSERRGGSMPLRELLDCKLHGVKVVDVATHFEKNMGQIRRDSVSAGWLIFGGGFEQGPIRSFVKRLFDIACASLLIVMSLPLMAMTALLILLESKGPVLYLQERVGLNGQLFNVVKFRSMRTDAEKDGKPRWASATDDRVTRVGRLIRKLRIDELPQLFCVMVGDMSLVGPRPERPYFVAQLTQNLPYYAVRHSVKPGITGWAQVRYHYGASIEDSAEKLQYDLYYVKNHTLLLDVVVLISTIGVVLTGKGAQ